MCRIIHLKALQSLNLSWCLNVGGTSLNQISSECVNLQEIFMEGCARINATDILDLSASVIAASTLRIVSVARCPRVTDMAIAALGKRCKVLQHLDASYCPKVRLVYFILNRCATGALVRTRCLMASDGHESSFH